MISTVSIPPARTRVAIAATVGNALGVTATVHAPFGIFLIPLSETFGWPRASISAVLGIIAVVGALCYPIAGRFADRHGARGILLVGNVALAASVALLAASNGNLALFYASFALIAMIGALNSTAIYSQLVSRWFDRNRGTMLGVTAGLGNGIGGMIMPMIAAVVLAAAGWRAAYLALAAAVFVIGFPILFAGLRDAPAPDIAQTVKDEATGMTPGEAARTPVFWLLLVSIASGAGCLTAIFSHVVPILAERGIGIAVSTSVLSLFAMICAGWQIAMGRLLDRLPTPRIVAPMYVLAVGGLALLVFGSSVPLLMLGAALLGIGLGSQYGALPFLISRYFGLRAFGAITGLMYSGVVLLQGITPILLDHAFDVQGTYRFAIEVIGLCLVGGAALLLLLPGYGKRDDAGAPLATIAHV